MFFFLLSFFCTFYCRDMHMSFVLCPDTKPGSHQQRLGPLHLFCNCFHLFIRGMLPATRNPLAFSKYVLLVGLPCCCHVDSIQFIQSPPPVSEGFLWFFFTGFFTVGYTKLISELFTLNHTLRFPRNPLSYHSFAHSIHNLASSSFCNLFQLQQPVPPASPLPSPLC